MPSYCRSYPGVYKGAKHFEEIPNCDLKLLGAVACKYTWTPGIFDENYREKNFWRKSIFTGFDVDNTIGEPYSLEAAINDWCDTACIIATSRSHQIAKRDFPPADRFRIIVQWEIPITDRAVYEYNMAQILKVYPQFDKVCKDSARLFYPCNKIVYSNFDGYLQPVLPIPEKVLAYQKLMRNIPPGRPPQHVLDFIYKGKPFGGSRNISVYVTTLELLKFGMDEEKVLEMIRKSPFDRSNFPDQELEQTYGSALKRHQNK